MPAQYYSGGGLKINPIINASVDPVEQAIRQAQLYNLQQDPKFHERALTLQQLGLEHTQQNDEAMRRIQEAGLLEQTRHNTATEKLDTGRLGETTRSNLVGEALTQRGQDVTMRGQDLETGARADTNKTQITTALIHTMLGNLDPTDPEHHVAAETLSKLGYPQLKESLGTQPLNKDQEMAAAALAMFKKQQDTTTTVPAFGTTPVQSREYQRPKFNLFKFLRGGGYQ